MEGQEAQAEGVQQPKEELNQLGPLCQVEGCAADLLSEKRYCLKKRICSQHMQSDVVHKRGVPEQQWRFCFQCGKLEPLERFDGKQRSCRTRLELRRKPKRSNSSLDAPRQQEPASPSARKAKRSRRSNRSSSCAQETDTPDAGSGQWDQDQSLMQAVMWQFACGNNSGCAADAGACDFSSCGGYTADSCQGDTAAAVAAAAAAARLQQSCGAVGAEAAAVQAAAGLARTNTAVSANAVAALLSERVTALKPVPRATSAPAAAPASTGYNLKDLNSPRALRGHMASLQKQCQVLQSQLAQQRQQQQQSASVCRPAASAAAGFACAAAVPAAKSRGMAAVPPVLSARATPALQQQQQQQQLALQRHGSRETPSSPDESAMTAVTAVNHMELVEMVVAQLDDSNTSAAAAELEAMLEHELRAAASLPPEHAKNTWASQLNDVINDWSSVISSAAMPPFGGCFAAPAAGAACATPFGGLLARQYGADVWGMGAEVTASQGAMPVPAVDSAGKKAFDLKLMTLQQQLSELQGLVYNLRAQFTS